MKITHIGFHTSIGIEITVKGNPEELKDISGVLIGNKIYYVNDFAILRYGKNDPAPFGNYFGLLLVNTTPDDFVKFETGQEITIVE